MSREPAKELYGAMFAVVIKDLTAIRRSKPTIIPMAIVPLVLLVLVPLMVVLVASTPGAEFGVDTLLDSMPDSIDRSIRALPEQERMVVLINGYLMAPLFLVVPMMLTSVLAADAFAGEKERRTLESLLYLPIGDRALFYAKVLGAFVPAIAVSWLGFVTFAVVVNASAWPLTHRVFVPTGLWMFVVLWVAPAVAALSMGLMVRVSARVRTTQEANQLGGAVILPVIFLVVGQSTGLLIVTPLFVFAVGAAVWAIALWLILRGAARFTRDRLATSL